MTRLRLGAFLSMAILSPDLSAQRNVSEQIGVSDVVRILICDPWGKPLETARLHFQAAGGSENLAKSPEARSISGVPYGRYIAQASIPGYSVKRHILVNARSLYVVLSIPFRWGDSEWEGGFLEITGKITPVPPKGSLVRVRGVYLDDQREAAIDESGAFEVGGLDSGAFVVEVFTGTRLLHAEAIDIDQRLPVHKMVIRIPGLVRQGGTSHRGQ